ncbi:homoserine kinase [Williamsia sp. CHRR-6]|uniref:homoserine kinase n=1 Tax=Williamsia sp. CHRR-6 TaxID=2835871 RepID=UPI001BDA7766|nr:homoserine kinase [Williamsia sp. CHRR-6]MBT0568432.1 homoserine kinase [Williamsia sp. CHRR-6]
MSGDDALGASVVGEGVDHAALHQLSPDVSCTVRVAASTANLGAGFDCLGLALDLSDEVRVQTTAVGTAVTVTGEGRDGVPLDDSHLVVRALRRGLAVAGASAAGLDVVCVNAIPHSRGLGSSAAAVVSGLAAASGLVVKAGVGDAFSPELLVQLASEFEGHPDNAAASVLGAAVVSWTENHDDGHGPRYRARRLELHPDIRLTTLVPRTESSTAQTRGLLPDVVPRADAVFNLSRSALAVVALTADPDCLLAATADRLHQGYRAPVLPETTAVVAALRGAGVAAFVSGAGPSVMALHVGEIPRDALATAFDLSFQVHERALGGPVTIA